jgi:hypothetical protein
LPPYTRQFQGVIAQALEKKHAASDGCSGVWR